MFASLLAGGGNVTLPRCGGNSHYSLLGRGGNVTFLGCGGNSCYSLLGGCRCTCLSVGFLEEGRFPLSVWCVWQGDNCVL